MLKYPWKGSSNDRERKHVEPLNSRTRLETRTKEILFIASVSLLWTNAKVIPLVTVTSCQVVGEEQ